MAVLPQDTPPINPQTTSPWTGLPNATTGGPTAPAPTSPPKQAPQTPEGPGSNPKPPQRSKRRSKSRKSTHTSASTPASTPTTTPVSYKSGNHDTGNVSVDQFLQGLAKTEHGVYDWQDNGAGAYGAYQILSSNWPEWAKEAGVDPNDHSQAAQDAVARHKVLEYYHDYHDWKLVAAAWFGGPGNVAAYQSGQDRSDGNVSTSDYINRVMSNAGAAPTTTSLGAGETGKAGQAGNVQLDMQQLEQKYGAVSTLLKDTSLQKLVQQAVTQGWDDTTFNAKLLDSNYYKKYSDAQRNWAELQATDSGEAKVERAKMQADVSKNASALGVRLNPVEVQHIANLALSSGWNIDSTELQEAIGAHFQMQQSHALGTAGSVQDQINQYASDYGIKISQATVNQFIRRSLTDKLTPDSLKGYFEQQASTLYPGLAPQIAKGLSVAQVASSYRDSMAQLLEQDPNSIDMFDPLVQKALQYQPDPSKPSTLMPLYQFEQQVRQDPRWLNTDNARQSAMDTAIGVLKDWGLTS